MKWRRKKGQTLKAQVETAPRYRAQTLVEIEIERAHRCKQITQYEEICFSSSNFESKHITGQPRKMYWEGPVQEAI